MSREDQNLCDYAGSPLKVLGDKTTTTNVSRKLSFVDSSINVGGTKSESPSLGVNDGETLADKVEIWDTTKVTLDGVNQEKGNITMQVEGVVMEGNQHGMEVDGKESGEAAVIPRLVVESGLSLNNSDVAGYVMVYNWGSVLWKKRRGVL
jgi:hypothetical protein